MNREPEMHISIETFGDVTVVTVDGGIDIQTQANLKKRVRELLHIDGVRKILLELSGVDRIDSSGIGLLVSLLNSARTEGGDLRLAGTLAPSVDEALRLCNLQRVFTRYDNVQEGISEFNS